jgi:pimeloyl-ACP methyl ester carboxylesterase
VLPDVDAHRADPNADAAGTDAGAPPVMLVHGWGGSFAATWQRSGFTDLLADAGREVIGVDLLGHGNAPKPHDPDAYNDLTERVVAALPDRPVDAIGFSLGAQTLLRTAIAEPGRFRRLVLAGIGRNVFERDEAMTRRIVAAIDDGGRSTHINDDPDHADMGNRDPDNVARLFAQYASQAGNDPAALRAIMVGGAVAAESLTERELAGVRCPVLIVVGDKDFVLPADRLVAALPDATLRTLRRTDHFATPESFAFIDAALEFIDAVPR